MKGIMFLGDSFTWGQGLQYYSNLPNIDYNCDDGFDISKVSEAHLKYIQKNRFARIVADYFNTFEIVRLKNGGTIRDCVDLLNNFQYYKETQEISTKPFCLDDISYLIFQFTDLFRFELYFEYDGESKWFDPNNDKSENYDLFISKFLEKNNTTLDEYIKNYGDYLCIYLEKIFRNIEEKGIKVLITTWPSSIISSIKKNGYLNDRLLYYYLDYNETNCFEDFEFIRKKNGQGFTIARDNTLVRLDGSCIPDGHLSKEAHELVAQSIINKIKEYESARVHTV